MSWVADRAYASRGPIPCCTPSEPIASLILTNSRRLSLPRLYAPNYIQRQGKKWQGVPAFQRTGEAPLDIPAPSAGCRERMVTYDC